MDKNLAQKAVAAALSGNWEEAINLNEQLLKSDKKDVDALNRLARAYAERGNLKKAKESARKVLKLDPYNVIATKSLKKWKSLRRGGTTVSGPSSAAEFIEEPGKTKIVSLLHLGAPKTLAKLDSGDKVKLSPHKHRVSVTTLDKKYIGRLPDDVAATVRRLVGYGNEYQALVKSIQPQEVRIFLREVKRADKLKDTPSFPLPKQEN